MLKNIFIFTILLSLLACEHPRTMQPNTQDKIKTERNKQIVKKHLIINLDKKREESSRGGSTKELIKGSFFLGDNDEVSFKGNILREKAPITITYGDNDEVSINGDDFNIKASELKDGMHIIIKDRNNRIFVDQVVREY